MDALDRRRFVQTVTEVVMSATLPKGTMLVDELGNPWPAPDVKATAKRIEERLMRELDLDRFEVSRS